ncbi:phosphatase PAP2 family protein [Hylemonella sp. W303a]|uniref:phosphatase PAP2 family protein n=1 Tax=Hylemonella sp. W303a TaxID=3389873 RepID=UPI00396B1285
MKNRWLRGLMVCCLALASYACADGARRSGVEEAGDFLQLMIPSYALGIAVSEHELTGRGEGVAQFGMTMLSTALAAHSLKSTTQQKRPDYDSGDDRDSFPSGHTASAFAGATFIHRRYGFSQAAVPYALAAFVGYSRVKADAHHPRDVAGGALIAGFSTWLFVDEGQQTGACNRIETDFGDGRVQVSCSMRF